MTLVADALAEADELKAKGAYRAAIDCLTTANRTLHDPVMESRLVRLRHEAFELEPSVAPAAPPAWIHAAADPGPFVELTPADLNIGSLRDGIARHGSVLVRGLLTPDRVAQLVEGIDHAFEAFDAGLAGAPVAETRPWFERFKPTHDEQKQLARRSFVRAAGGVWAVDSPRMLFMLMDLVADLGIDKLATEFLGERPALSANKCNLRMVPPTSGGGWHQDGAFLGRDVRSLNLWIALSEAGGRAATMDIIPKRFDELVQSGTEGAMFDWTVAPAVAREAAGDAGIIRPRFEPGDAMLFDHMFLHRTATTPEMTESRYAIESWFFAPSHYPSGQIPFVY